MIQRVLAIGLIAGLVAGLAVAALQHVTTTPLILAAEVYETAQHGHDEDEGWKPTEGLQRTAATSVATVATACGYAFVLIGLMLAAGEAIEPRRAVAWAACGFASTGLATGLGLAPQLPGAAETDVVMRQIWWVFAAGATSAGLFLLLRREGAIAKIIGLLAMAAPHLVGAPKPATPESAVPAELAARFAASSLAVHAVVWVLTGALVGLLWREFSGRESKAASEG